MNELIGPFLKKLFSNSWRVLIMHVHTKTQKCECYNILNSLSPTPYNSPRKKYWKHLHEGTKFKHKKEFWILKGCHVWILNPKIIDSRLYIYTTLTFAFLKLCKNCLLKWCHLWLSFGIMKTDMIMLINTNL